MGSISETKVKHDDDHYKLNADLYRALLSEDAGKVKELCSTVGEQGLHVLTIHDDTVLHAATYSKQTQLVLHLLDELPPQHLDKMTRQNHTGNTILHEAVVSNEQIEVAKKILEKAPGLLCMRNHLGETALFRSVRYGNEKIFQFLAVKISEYKEVNQQLFLKRTDKSTILHAAVLSDAFDLALHIAEKYKHLVGERDADGMTALQLLSCKPGAFQRKETTDFFPQIIHSASSYFTSTKQPEPKYISALNLAKFLIERDASWEATYPAIDPSKPRLHKYGGRNPTGDQRPGVGQGSQLLMAAADVPETDTPLFLATKSGCVDIAEEILKRYPQAVEHIDDKGRNILHIAIKYRQLSIFYLVTKGEVTKRRLVRKFDKEGNSILHVVGMKSKDYMPEKLQSPARELQDEMQWFERVKSKTPPHFHEHRNGKKLTAEQFFYKENKELRTSATEWIKRTSEGCTVVAVLIATVAFAAAYTVPGGPNSQTGTPVLVNKPLFVVFTATDVLSLSFALTSVVIFLSIVSSSFRFQDFKESLPNKLMFGFTFLFLSVSMMMFAFGSTVLLMIQNRESWTKIILYALSFLPVGIFALSYFPLYISLSVTYKYLLQKLKWVIPWKLFGMVLSIPTYLCRLFCCCRNLSTNSLELPRSQSTQNRHQ